MRHVLRKPPFGLYAVDFDEFPGLGGSYSGSVFPGTEDYRKNTKMCICRDRDPGSPKFFFDCEWDRFTLVLHAGEFASYSFSETMGQLGCSIDVSPDSEGTLILSAGGQCLQIELKKECSRYSGEIMLRVPADGLKISVQEGAVSIKKLVIL